MKTHIIDPNKIRPGIANFTIEFRYAEKPKETMISSYDAINQRWLRLVEMPVNDGKSRKTVWHEIYAEDLSSNSNFTKWAKKRCRQFTWLGKPKDFFKLSEIMGGMASSEVMAKRGLATTNETPISPEEE
jgi:hypothetical protein